MRFDSCQVTINLS